MKQRKLFGPAFLLIKSLAAAAILLGAVAPSGAAPNTVPPANLLAVFDQATALITKKFYDQSFRGLPWARLVVEARLSFLTTPTAFHLKQTVNDLLARLNASHTEFLSADDQEFHALKGVFSGEIDDARLGQIGAWFEETGARWFVRDVFENGPAARAGILAGDEMISVDGRAIEPVRSFLKPGFHRVVVRRRAGEKLRHFSLRSENMSFQRAMLEASKSSYRIFIIGGKRIAYFHLWAGTHEEFKNALRAAAVKAAAESDSFVLDLRDGFGGASPEYLAPFLDQYDEGARQTPVYQKPMVVLINEGVRSGKEWLAYVIKQTGRATLVGTRTKGYFLAGKVFALVDPHFLLYLAVAAPESGVPALEGRGVTPDVNVVQSRAYRAAKDEPLMQALAMCSAARKPKQR